MNSAVPPVTLEELAVLSQRASTVIERLRERDRELLEACYADEGVNATAGRMGRSPQSVHNSLRRIRRALFDCVRRTLGEPETD